MHLDRLFFYGCRLAAAAVVITAAAVVTAAASKEDNKDDYPSAAISAKETVITVTHNTDLLSVFNIILCFVNLFVTEVCVYVKMKYKNNV